NAKTDFDAAQQRFDAGLATKLDVLEAKSNYDDTLYSLESAKGDVKTAQATLAQAIGFAADTKFRIMHPAKNLPTQISEKDVTLLIEESIEKRQDIAALRADLKTKNALVRAATSDLLPTLNLGASGQKSKYKQYDSTSGITQVDHTYSAFASVNWNIFDGFYNLNKRRQAKAESDMAFDALIQAEVALSADVWTKYYNFYTAVQKLKFSETFFKTASASYELARESYVSGLKSILDLLQSQTKLKDARSRLIQSKEDVFIALAELAHATGSLSADNKEADRAKIELGRNKGER
ncbi:MAG: TolC family protein, partial [Candidatus Omnitrophica bacterium]|nr:TolC family protein [Candidatus Omnitrophota bacterium]